MAPIPAWLASAAWAALLALADSVAPQERMVSLGLM